MISTVLSPSPPPPLPPALSPPSLKQAVVTKATADAVAKLRTSTRLRGSVRNFVGELGVTSAAWAVGLEKITHEHAD